jgi:undecaprenyl-diphosphatase
LIPFRFLPLTALLVSLSFSQERENFDVRLFRSINSHQSPATGFFEVIDKTSLPTFAVIPAGLLLYGYASDVEESFDLGITLGVAQAATFLVVTGTKGVVDRRRPYEVLDGVKAKHVWSAGGGSFPSGHAAMAFTVATTLSLYSPKPEVWIPSFAWASFVACARVYLGLHYPSDILGGAVMGTGLAFLTWSFRDDIRRLTDKVLGRSDKNLMQISPFPSGTEFLRISIKL